MLRCRTVGAPVNDLSFGHLLFFALFVGTAMLVFAGARLCRCVVFLACWQLFTPDWPLWLDLALMSISFLALEIAYASAVVARRRTGAALRPLRPSRPTNQSLPEHAAPAGSAPHPPGPTAALVAREYAGS